ncbi:MAG: glycosyl transferase [Herbinix sp.]|jgi:glycosyltransferase involved in cell wall biosynthesis|nr:glycosyl transferase [Herbinix sp.]
MISVIVPVYNGSKYLEICIDSIINQSYKDIEIILIDDCSKDNSLEICRYYEQQDERIKIITNNITYGTSKARNKGINAAKGEFLVFIDDDDFIDEYFIETLYKKQQYYNADIIQCYFKSFENKEDIKNTHKNQTDAEYDGINAIKLLCSSEEQGVQFCVVFNKLFRRTLFDTIRYDDGKVHEDVFIMHKLFLKANKTVFISNDLYYYRKTPTSITRKPYNKTRLDSLEGMELRAIYVKNLDHDLYVKALIQLLHCQINNYYNLKKFYSKDKEDNFLVRSNFKRYYKIVIKNKNILLKWEIKKFRKFYYIPSIFYLIEYRKHLIYNIY